MNKYFEVWQRQRLIVCAKFSSFNVGDYIDILITEHVKCLHMNYDNLFMFHLHSRSLKQVFRTGGKINEWTLQDC